MDSEDYFRVMNFSDSLSVCATNHLSWDGSQKAGSRWLGITFDGLDKEALFFRALGVFDPAGSVNGRIPVSEWNDGKYWQELWQRSQASLLKATEPFPLLRRFEPEYEDVVFSSDEINDLKEACLAVKRNTNDPAAVESLDKLLLACDEALKDGVGLFFASN